jgi:Kef-type K+ transport system membrane component KefB
MSHPEIITFFVQLAFMLAVAVVSGQLMRTWGQPAVLGELIGGILLGPTVLGALFPAYYTWLFPDTGNLPLARETLVKLGMLFFLFIAGLEVNLSYLRQRGLSTVLTSLLGMVIPFSLGFGSVWFLPQWWGALAQRNLLMLSLFISTALAISALPVIVRILKDLGLINQELGAVIIGAAIVNDVIGWTLFAVILSEFIPNQAAEHSFWITLALVIIYFVFILSLGRWAGRPLLHWIQTHLPWPSGFIGVTAVLVLSAAAMAEAIGIHAFFGAFLVGVALAQNDKTGAGHQAHETVYQFVVSFLTPIYFVSIGLKANFLAHFDFLLVMLVLGVACVGKILGAGGGAWWGGMSLPEALVVGFGMNARGAIEIILASVALEYGLIDQRIFVALVIMAIITSMMSGPAIQSILGSKLNARLAQNSSELHKFDN